jgi:MobA-like NTP transferase domain
MKPTLLVLAAGRGSRFGGPKQLAAVGPTEEPLLAYTIHDAARAGFGRVVLVCPHGLGADMSESFGACTGGVIPIVAVEQTIPDGRDKPWGTGHAVLEASDALGSIPPGGIPLSNMPFGEIPFGVANGDDWYGPDALVTLAGALTEPGRTSHVIITFELARTMAFTEGVSRGYCEVHGSSLWGVREVFDVRRDGVSYFGHTSEGTRLELAPETPISMNLWGFMPSILRGLERQWQAFSGEEFLLPHAVSALIESGAAAVEARPCATRPFGLTRPEDLDTVRAEIAGHVASGHYPADLRSGIA